MLCVDTRSLCCVLTRGHRFVCCHEVIVLGANTRSLYRVLTQGHCVVC